MAGLRFLLRTGSPVLAVPPTFSTRNISEARNLEEFAFSNRELALLHDVSASIQAFTDLDKLLQFILKKVKATFKIFGASMALHDPHPR